MDGIELLGWLAKKRCVAPIIVTNGHGKHYVNSASHFASAKGGKPYIRAVGRLMLIAAVRRVRRPGCKFDQMPIFEGAQGINKSDGLTLKKWRDFCFARPSWPRT